MKTTTLPWYIKRQYETKRETGETIQSQNKKHVRLDISDNEQNHTLRPVSRKQQKPHSSLTSNVVSRLYAQVTESLKEKGFIADFYIDEKNDEKDDKEWSKQLILHDILTEAKIALAFENTTWLMEVLNEIRK